MHARVRRALAALLACSALASGCVALNRVDARDPRPVTVNRPHAAAPAAELTVATYNVHGASIAELIAAFERHEHLRNADVVFVQELESDPRALASALDRSVAYAPGYQRSHDGTHGVAIVSLSPLRDVRVIELPRYHTVVNSARRIALRATVDVGDGELHVYSVHLDNRINPADRSRQLAPVLADARRLQAPVIIGGDMNTSPFCWLGHLLPVPCGRQDDCVERTVRAHGFDTPVTASGATSKWIGMRLDALYTRGLTPAAYGVHDDARISDHLPLWAAFAVAPSRR